jgi:polyhydroxyalkanoate synthesis regulator phasin
MAAANLGGVSDPLIDPLSELRAQLERAASRLRSGELEPDEALAVVEDCARLAAQASAQVDERVRAALEPLPDLPGQLPLAAG